MMWSFAFQLREQLLFLFWTDTYKNAQDQTNDYINPREDCWGLGIVVYKQCGPVELSSSELSVGTQLTYALPENARGWYQ